MDFKFTTLPIETELPKLVRDNIPSIIKQKEGKTPRTSSAIDDKLFLNFLLKKLVEESVEAQAHTNKEELVVELADIKEVINAIMHLINITDEAIDNIGNIKGEKNGGFNNRTILESK